MPDGSGIADPQPGCDAAAARLVRTYLHRFGPVTTTDVQWWMGSTLGLVKRVLITIGAVDMVY